MRTPLLIAATVLLAGCAVADDQTGAAFKETGQLIALSGGDGGASNACFTCHGIEGEGDGAFAPRLAGLSVGYLDKQLNDYASQLRPDKVMAPIAKRLTDADRAAVSAYYAALAAPTAVEPALAAPAAYMDNCAACHGDNGEGVGPANPALAGQSAAYLREQLWRFRRTERRNDPRGVMLASAAELSPAEVEATATWLSTRSSAQAPRSDAASLSAAAAAAQRWAASHAARHRAQ